MDIEKDIEKVKKLNNLLKFFKTHGWIPNMSRNTNINETIEAIEHILAERETDKKKIEELEDENNKLKKHCKEIIKDKQKLTSGLLDSIPKQKVKEILIEIQEEYNKLDKEIDKQIKDKNKDYYKCKENIAIMQTLAYCRDKFEGLLEEK